MGRVGNAGLRRLANQRLPDLLASGRIDGDQAAVARPDEDFALPHRHARVRARRVRTIERLIQSHLRIKLPNQFPSGCLQGVHLGLRRADVGDTVDDNGLGNDAHAAIDFHVPSEPQSGSVLIRNLLQRAEVMRFEVAPVEEPIGAVGVSGNTIRIYVPNLGRTIGQSGREDDQSSCDTESSQSGNSESCESRWRRHGHLFPNQQSKMFSHGFSKDLHGSSNFRSIRANPCDPWLIVF